MAHAPGEHRDRPRTQCAIPGCERLVGPGYGGYCSGGHRHAARLIADPDFDTDLGVVHLDDEGSRVLAEMLDDPNVDPSGESYARWMRERADETRK